MYRLLESKYLLFSVILITIFINFLSCNFNDEPKIIEITTDEIVVDDANIVAFATIVSAGEGIIEHGHCWSLENSTPTILHDSKTTLGARNETGQYISEVEQMEVGKYYIRAYATDGTNVVYGETKTFEIIYDFRTVTDIDGNVYPIVTIGNQTWMAENLRVSRARDGTFIESFCYNESGGNCEELGRLYPWDAAMSISSLEPGIDVCPEGWHVPTDTEWKELEIFMGMTSFDANNTGWRGTIQGDMLKMGGSSGFNAIMAGYRSSWDGEYKHKDTHAYFWTATEFGAPDKAYARVLSVLKSSIERLELPFSNAYSVRCIRDKKQSTVKNAAVPGNYPQIEKNDTTFQSNR